MYYQIMVFRDKFLSCFHQRIMTIQCIAVPQYILTKPKSDRLQQKHDNSRSLVISYGRTFYSVHEIKKMKRKKAWGCTGKCSLEPVV